MHIRVRTILIACVVVLPAIATSGQSIDAQKGQTPEEKAINRPKDDTLYPRISSSQLERLRMGRPIEKVTIPAEMLTQILTRGPDTSKRMILDLTSCYVEGELKLSKTQVYATILFDNCSFENVTLDQSEFREDVSVEDCFVKELSAEETIFRKDADFDNCDLVDMGSFRKAQFLGVADFSQSRFQSDFIIFDEVVFTSKASFESSQFKSQSSFDKAVFKEQASFDSASFYGPVSFDRAGFDDVVSFRSVGIGHSMDFISLRFPSSVIFDDLHRIDVPKPEQVAISPVGAPQPAAMNDYYQSEDPSSLKFVGVTFGGAASFDNLSVESISFPKLLSVGTKTRNFHSGVFEKAVSFRGTKSKVADFSDVEFRDFFDLSNATITATADMRRAVLVGGASFYETIFPYPRGGDGVLLEGVRIDKPVKLDWGQIGEQLNSTNPDTWGKLEQVFKLSGNLEGENEAMYKKRRLSGASFFDSLSFFSWGYGVRPWRVLFWILIGQSLFTFAYWTQIVKVGQGMSKLEDRWTQVKFATKFGWKTAISLKHGIANARTNTFKILAGIHAISMKVLFILFLMALSHVSPLLHEVLGKLIPV